MLWLRELTEKSHEKVPLRVGLCRLLCWAAVVVDAAALLIAQDHSKNSQKYGRELQADMQQFHKSNRAALAVHSL